MRALTLNNLRRWLPLILLDVVAVYGSYAAALLLRFDAEVPAASWRLFLAVSPGITAGYLIANLLFGVYRAAWKYGDVRDVFSLALAVATVTLVIFGVNFSFPRRHLPLSVNLIGGGLIFLAMASMKLWPRFAAAQYFPFFNSNGLKRVLIVGAADVGQLVAREFLHNPHWRYRPVCFVDDDPLKQGMRIHGVPVEGNRYEIPRLVVKHQVDVIAFAFSSVTSNSFQELMEICRRVGVPVNIVPSPADILSGKTDRAVVIHFQR